MVLPFHGILLLHELCCLSEQDGGNGQIPSQVRVMFGDRDAEIIIVPQYLSEELWT